MRVRLLAVLAMAILAFSPHHAAAADLPLSPGFLQYAPDYLHTARDCSYRVLADNPIPCDYEDISDKTRSAAATPGDKLVADNFDSWIVSLVLYSRAASDGKTNPQKLAQMQDGLKHVSDVCSAELGKALEDKTAPEKSPCSDALNAINAQ